MDLRSSTWMEEKCEEEEADCLVRRWKRQEDIELSSGPRRAVCKAGRCRGLYGPHMVLHFAHKHGTDCWSKGRDHDRVAGPHW